MKTLLSISILLILLPLSASAENLKAVENCLLGAGQSAQVAVLSAQPIADSAIYYLQQQQKLTPAFASAELSRGAAISIQCSGREEKALVVSGEFSANYLQGFALRYNSASHELERIDFAERNRPSWVYLNQSGMAVVFQNIGNESSKKYLVYQYISGKGQAEAAYGTNRVPTDSSNIKITLIDAQQ
ncbi:hypothetical protein [Pseudomonas sp.]|uniref:hypothetical protein n=1 Tax=Pseudomonas sp. TaxID=306 RepID=UPI002735099B|nr:hypothetical protein [Pseudomonas sp.]MDP3817236.1 hypothetical protein [Pseudomonas sp.]